MQAGDVIILRKDSRYYNQTPPNMIGVVKEGDPDIYKREKYWWVRFENGYHNCYRDKDCIHTFASYQRLLWK